MAEVQLFVLQSAVIRKDLNGILNHLRVGNQQSSLERETDSLISGYLSQIDYRVINDAERMAGFYQVFFALENDIRALVEETLETGIGEDWWRKSVPQHVRENVQRNVDREASEGLPPRSSRSIEYTTFGELNDIIRENWDSFSGLFLVYQRTESSVY